MNYVQEARHRKGTKIAVLIALMAALPGLVAGTSFITGSGSSTLTGTPAVSGGIWCGFASPVAVVQDTSYITSQTYTTEIGTGVGAGILGSPAGGLFSTVAFTITILKVGATGYEYLDGEYDVGCSGTPATGTLTVTPSMSVITTTNIGWTEIFMEKAAAVGTQPDYTYCAPGAAATHQPTGIDVAYGGACSGSSITDPACTAATTYLPNDGDVTAANWYATTLGSAANTCGAVATMASFSPANGLATTSISWYGTVSFAFYNVGAATATGTFVLTLTGVQS